MVRKRTAIAKQLECKSDNLQDRRFMHWLKHRAPDEVTRYLYAKLKEIMK